MLSNERDSVSQMLSSKAIEKRQRISYELSEISVEEIEAFIYQGFAYAVSADHNAAILTSPYSDEDTIH